MNNFQVIHGQYDSIIFPETFSLGSSKQLFDLLLGDNRILLTGPGIYPQILELHAQLYLFVRGSNKQQKRGRIISNFTEGETFFIFYNNQVLLGVISRCTPPSNTAQKMTFSIKDFFSKCDQIRSFLQFLCSVTTLKKGLPLPFSLAKKRIYLDTHLKGELTDLF